VGLWAVALFTILFEFGFRVGEALKLRVRQLDFLNRSIDLNPGETKNGHGRTAIMTSRVFELLKACCIGKEPEDWVFTRGARRPVLDFRGTWDKVTTAAGLSEVLVHDLRRSAVKRMIQRGIPQTTAMKISGHRTEAVFRRYAIVSEQDLRDAARRLEQKPVELAPAQVKHETMGTTWAQMPVVPEIRADN
jgi:integrase